MPNPFTDQKLKEEIESGNYPSLNKLRRSSRDIAKKMADEVMIKVDGLIHQKQIIFGVVPSKSNCYRIVTIPCKAPKKPFSSLAKTKELREYERSFGLQCARYRNAGIQTDFKFEMDVYYPSRRADLDGSLKCVLDCLQPATKSRPFAVGAITNDNLCKEIVIRRHIDTQNPRIEFVITPLKP